MQSTIWASQRRGFRLQRSQQVALILGFLASVAAIMWQDQHVTDAAITFGALVGAVTSFSITRRRTRNWKSAVIIATPPALAALWFGTHVVLKVLGVPHIEGGTCWAIAAGVGIAAMLAASVAIHTDGSIGRSLHGVREGLDCGMITAGVVTLFWFFFGQYSLDTWHAASGLVLASVAALPVTRMTNRRMRLRPQGLVGLTLAMGAILTSAQIPGWPTMCGIAGVVLGLSACSIQLPMRTRQPRFSMSYYETDNILPSLFLMATWTVCAIFQVPSLDTFQSMGLLITALALVGCRLVVVRNIEAHVLTDVHRLAFQDPLTGIQNRRALVERLEVGNGYIMTLDLDGFKGVNDQFGHEAGDQVLQDFVVRIRGVLPPEAHFFRIGGDEFAIVVPEEYREVAKLSRDVVRGGADPHYAGVSVSVGVAEFGDGKTPAQSLRGSDIALQEAKRTGKNRAAVFTSDMLADRMRELAIASRLRSGGLEDIFMVYQPLVAMAYEGQPMIAVEALARWNDRELGSVPPGEFVPVAERNGLIPSLGLIVLKQALEQLRVWMNEGTPIQISVNVSALQLRDPAVVEQMATLLAVEPELARWIILEVTETVFSEDDRAVSALRELRALGLCTAVDDFGTGASTLTRLRSLPVDVLKIDRSLIQGAGVDDSADAILEMISTLGRRMGMILVAEGLEDAIATRRCTELGYAVGQGYIFSQPVPASLLPQFAILSQPALPRRPNIDRQVTPPNRQVPGQRQPGAPIQHNGPTAATLLPSE